MTDQPLKDALNAVLLFHSASPWNEEKKHEWQRLCRSLLGSPQDGKPYSSYIIEFDASTRTLCDMVRAALKQAETQTIP